VLLRDHALVSLEALRDGFGEHVEQQPLRPFALGLERRVRQLPLVHEVLEQYERPGRQPGDVQHEERDHEPVRQLCRITRGQRRVEHREERQHEEERQQPR
jgi:hypothetical protein